MEDVEQLEDVLVLDVAGRQGSSLAGNSNDWLPNEKIANINTVCVCMKCLNVYQRRSFGTFEPIFTIRVLIRIIDHAHCKHRFICPKWLSLMFTLLKAGLLATHG